MFKIFFKKNKWLILFVILTYKISNSRNIIVHLSKTHNFMVSSQTFKHIFYFYPNDFFFFENFPLILVFQIGIFRIPIPTSKEKPSKVFCVILFSRLFLICHLILLEFYCFSFFIAFLEYPNLKIKIWLQFKGHIRIHLANIIKSLGLITFYQKVQ